MKEIAHAAGCSVQFAERVAQEVPGFRDSEEYRRLDSDELTLPGLVFSALASYLEIARTEAVDVATLIIEAGAVTDDEELHNYLVTEVFERWHVAEESTRSRLMRALRPRGRELFDRWTNLIVPQA